MTDSLAFRISDLDAAVSRLLRAAESQLGERVVLSHDHYWHLPVDSAFDMSHEP